VLGGALAGVSAAAWLRSAAAAEPRRTGARRSDARRTDARRIALDNLHTGERLEVEYARGDAYDPAAFGRLEVLLRDFRTDERHSIDPKLMDLLVDLAQDLGVAPQFSVISGYRSPQTNEKLHEQSSGVAQHSLHMQGRAIDVRMPGIDCASLAARAVLLKRGGVGYYRASNFVHLDTGAFRTWRG
jgi:uncharacterized protein YcbK (DUF882 family)